MAIDLGSIQCQFESDLGYMRLDTSRALFKVLNLLEIEDEILFEQALDSSLGLGDWFKNQSQLNRYENKGINEEIDEILEDDYDNNSLDAMFDEDLDNY